MLNSSQEMPTSLGFILQTCAYSVSLKSGAVYMTSNCSTRELRGGKGIPDYKPPYRQENGPDSQKASSHLQRFLTVTGLAAWIIIIRQQRKNESNSKQKYSERYLRSLTLCCFSSPSDNIIKRIFNILKFTWVLFLATLDSFTAWLNSISREHIDISTVLRIERCMLTREIKKVTPLVFFVC